MGVMIRHKGIEHGILSDAPFVGARISAIDCNYNCPGCFNQELRTEPHKTEDVIDMLMQVKDNTLNEGIILGGLEWTEQYFEMRILVQYALIFRLKVMIYTHLTVTEFCKQFHDLCGLPNTYVKCGRYRKDDIHYYDGKYDVTLASSNQKIYTLSELK